MADLNAGAVIDRMRDVVGVATDIALGKYFGLGTSAVSNWRQRDRVPFEECVILSKRKGVSLDWLLLGVGPRDASELGRVSEDAASYPAPRLARMVAFLQHWHATRDENDQVWLEMQLARAVPEYAEWIATRKH